MGTASLELTFPSDLAAASRSRESLSTAARSIWGRAELPSSPLAKQVRRFSARNWFLFSAVSSTPVDKKVKLVVLRDGKRKTLKAKIAKMEEAAQTQLASARGSGTTSFGLRVQNLTADLAQRLGVDEKSGVVITAVLPGSSAANAGLHRQDIILEVDKQEVKDVDDLEEQLGKAEDGALLLIRRGDSTLFVPMEQPQG